MIILEVYYNLIAYSPSLLLLESKFLKVSMSLNWKRSSVWLYGYPEFGVVNIPGRDSGLVSVQGGSW